jgi:hypothetical protein
MARKRKQSMNAEAAADALPMDVDIDYVDENGENLNQQEIFEVKNGENLDQQESVEVELDPTYPALFNQTDLGNRWDFHWSLI